MLKKAVRNAFDLLGYSIARKNPRPERPSVPVDIVDPVFRRLYELCSEKTLTSPEAMYALYESVIYVVKNRIPGDFVECGVWKGGSAMMIALALKELGETERNIFLFDTFTGMTPATEKDVDFGGNRAQTLLETSDRSDASSVWCATPLEEVVENLLRTGFPKDNLHFVQGRVEDTVPSKAPATIALLRLDTDWYESTLHELKHLYPRLSRAGVLLLDDYGHWQGAREATDNYFRDQGIHLLLNRVSYTVRSCIKP